MNSISRQDRWRGLVIGTAVGDALGLPAEGLSRERAEKWFHHVWRHRFIGHAGMTSDDTDHTVFVGQCLLAHPENADAFARRLAWSLRFWLLSLPAGMGLATLKATLRLFAGISPTCSGVYSAGNGPAMRAAPIGAFFAALPEKQSEFLRASTVLTHTDPKAFVGAKAIAQLAGWIMQSEMSTHPEREEFAAWLTAIAPEDAAWREIAANITEALRQDFPVEAFAVKLGLEHGVTDYIYHTVPVVIYAWYRHFGDCRTTLVSVLNCGGDTDTTGAIAGALAGATIGETGLPAEWMAGIWEWPRSVGFLRKLADSLAVASETDKASVAPVGYFGPGILLRNALFLVLVLLHGLRRLAPPYGKP